MPADAITPGVSAIAGTGLFTGKARVAGSLVISLDHEPHAEEELGLLNHSCDPNLGWSGSKSLVAIRDIAEGTELTVDYVTVISARDWVLWCHCETYRCRQVIEGRDWQIPQLQQRYAGLWAPAVQQLIDRAGD